MRATSHDRLDPLRQLIGCSAAMDEVRALIRKAARAQVSVLILGETGTGKELVAQAIARLSDSKAFVPVNCAELTDEIADSELFGHERGAFTSAYSATTGLIGAANGGILFLDELARLSQRIQAKLLRVLETGEYRKVGSTRLLNANPRFLTATNGDVDGLVASGELHLDFLQRVDELRIVLMPLRSRPEDIPLLVRHFLKVNQAKQADAPNRIADAAMQLLLSHEWQGNVRELRKVVRVAGALAAPASCLAAEHIHQVLVPPFGGARPVKQLPTLAQARRAAEQWVTLEALARTNGNREQAAKLLATSEATLYRLLKMNGGRADSKNSGRPGPKSQRSTQYRYSSTVSPR